MEENEKQSGNPKTLKDYYYIGVTAFLVIIASAGVIYLLFHLPKIIEIILGFFEIIAPILYGFVIAYMLNPIMGFFEEQILRLYRFVCFKRGTRMAKASKYRKKIRALALFASLIVAVVFIYLLLQMLIPELIRSITGLVNDLPRQLEEFQKKSVYYINKYDGGEAVYVKVLGYLENWVRNDLIQFINSLAKSIMNYTMEFFSVLYNIIIGFIVAVYVLQSKENFAGHCKKALYSLLKIERANTIIRYTREVDDLFGKFFIGKLIDSLIIGFICFIVMTLFDWPYIILVSVIIGVTNIIPVFGPFIGGFPCALLIMLANPIQGIFFGIFVIILQGVDGNIIGPKILGDTTGLSAFWVLFSILLFGGLLGVKGMIIGVPVFAFIYGVAKRIIEDRLRAKKLNTSTDDYSGYKEIHYNASTGTAEYVPLSKKE